jgi:tetratricopeptide (TPR) repeat protein
LLEIFGQYDEAISLCRQGLARDPLSDAWWSALAHVAVAARRYSESEVAWRRVHELNPSRYGTHYFLGVTLMLQNRTPEALAEVEKEPYEGLRLAGVSLVKWAMGSRNQSDSALSEMERKYADSRPGNIAFVHAYRGETNAAFDWLDRAYRQRDRTIGLIKVWPLVDNLRSDPRFQSLLVKMKLHRDSPEVNH